MIEYENNYVKFINDKEEPNTPNKQRIDKGLTPIVSGQGEMQTTEFGAKRESNEGRGRFDLLPYEAIEALANGMKQVLRNMTNVIGRVD